jgi:succinate dehydrogenase/fumarate reductase flavoprotein subunit
MPTFSIEIWEDYTYSELRRYEIEASSAEEARELIRSGDMWDQDPDGDVVDTYYGEHLDSDVQWTSLTHTGGTLKPTRPIQTKRRTS